MKNLKPYLQKMIDDIDAGNSNIDEEESIKIAKFLRETTRTDIPMSKYQAYTYLNISRATFDNLVRQGKIPKGRKVPGFKELMWEKKDLKKAKK
jgi:hypothetical protein